jgi:predicted  nucleic acid-binding Zn-ribbon protein
MLYIDFKKLSEDGYLYFDEKLTDAQKKQALENLRKITQDQNEKDLQYSQKIAEVQQSLETLQSNSINKKDLELLQNSIKHEKNRNAVLNSQIKEYENDIKKLVDSHDKLVENEKNEKFQLLKQIKNVSNENKQLQAQVIELVSQINNLKAENILLKSVE